MKKIVSLVLVAACLATTVVACGKKDNGETTTPVQTTTPAPTTTQAQIELSDIYESVKAAYGENYLPSMQLDAEALASLKSITPDLYSEFIGEVPMISAHADEFMLFKAAEGKADALEAALNDYKDYLINESFQYPSNKIKVQSCEIVRHGDYMFFVLLGGPISTEISEQGEDAILAEAKAQVKIGVDVINEYFN